MLNRILWEYRKSKKNFLLNAQELRRLQDRKFKNLVRYVFDSIPYYHDCIRSKNLMPEDFQSTSDIRKLPILSKPDIVANFPSRITNVKIKAPIVRFTSGTTGPPLSILWGPKYCDVMTAIRMRMINVIGIGMRDRVAHVVYREPTERTINQARADDRLPMNDFSGGGMKALLFGSFDRAIPVTKYNKIKLRKDNVVHVLGKLQEMKPQVILSRPSYLRRLHAVMKQQNPSAELQVRTILSDGEILSRGTRRELSQLYRAEVYDVYGAAEFGALGLECPEHSGMHLNSDAYVFECLGKDGEEIALGESGELIVTSFHNEAMPLIRYRLGDMVVPSEDEKCNCGSSFSRLQRIDGRLNDGFFLRDRSRIAPGGIVDHLESVLGLRDFQLIQLDQKNLVIKLKRTSIVPQNVDVLKAYLESLLGSDLKIEIVPWREDEMPPKLRPIVSQVAG